MGVSLVPDSGTTQHMRSSRRLIRQHKRKLRSCCCWLSHVCAAPQLQAQSLRSPGQQAMLNETHLNYFELYALTCVPAQGCLNGCATVLGCLKDDETTAAGHHNLGCVAKQ